MAPISSERLLSFGERDFTMVNVILPLLKTAVPRGTYMQFVRAVPWIENSRSWLYGFQANYDLCEMWAKRRAFVDQHTRANISQQYSKHRCLNINDRLYGHSIQTPYSAAPFVRFSWPSCSSCRVAVELELGVVDIQGDHLKSHG